MNKEMIFNKFVDMVDEQVEHIASVRDDIIGEANISMIIELNTMIYTFRELTDLTKQEIEDYIKEKTGFSLDDLGNIESKLSNYL